MGELEAVQLGMKALRAQNQQLLERLRDAEQAVAALAGNEVDAVALSEASSPVLLHAAQEQLRGSQQLLRAIFDGALDAFALADEEGRFLDVNPAACRLFGAARDEIVGRSFLAFAAGDRAAVLSDFQDFLARGEKTGTFLLRRPDGSVRSLEFSAVANVMPGQHLWVLRDTTERLAAEESLRRNEALFRAVIEKSGEIISLTGRDLSTRYLTPMAWRLLGWSAEEMGVRALREFAIGNDRERIEDAFRLMMSTGQRELEIDFRLRHRDGSIRWVEATLTNLLDDPDVHAIVGNVRDVTQRKQAEAEVRESEARYRRIVETTSEGVWVSDANFITTFVNERMASLLGYRVEEMIGMPALSFVAEEGQARASAMAARRRITRAETYPNVYRKKDGTLVPALAKTNAIFSESGEYEGTLALLSDLTEQQKMEETLRRTQEQFRQAQKMEAVGRLAGGVAHDFNNLLTVMLSYSEFALSDLSPDDLTRADMGEIHKAARRATELTTQLLAFSRQQILQPRVLDLNQSLAGMQKLLGRLLGEDIELSLWPAAGLGRVLADPSQIEQVVMNLAVNARDAMPHGGKLTLETANVELDQAYASGRPGVTAGSYVMLAVSDTGVGMDKATQARIFEPFFTTKDVGKGTGLGLATVLGVVQQSGGHVAVYSEAGHGTTFKVYLPRTDRPAEALAEPAQVALAGDETILLVEDEVQVRTVACEILRRNGYTVLAAATGAEAIELAREHAGELDLLFSDVVMPGINGRKLAEELAPRHPRMKVLFASGYTDDAIVHHGVLDPGVAFLQKPFTPELLLRKVREVLDAAGA